MAKKRPTYRPGVDEPVPSDPVKAVPETQEEAKAKEEEANRRHSIPTAVRGATLPTGAGADVLAGMEEAHREATEKAKEAPQKPQEATAKPQEGDGSPTPQEGPAVVAATTAVVAATTQDFLTDDHFDPFELAKGKAVPVFTEEDQDRYHLLFSAMDKGERQCYGALREIRERMYWLLPKKEDGTPKYRSFGAWVEEEVGHDKSWATHAINWLAIMEAMEREGLHYRLTVHHAKALAGMGGKDNWLSIGGLAATLKEAGERRTHHLRFAPRGGVAPPRLPH